MSASRCLVLGARSYKFRRLRSLIVVRYVLTAFSFGGVVVSAGLALRVIVAILFVEVRYVAVVSYVIVRVHMRMLTS